MTKQYQGSVRLFLLYSINFKYFNGQMGTELNRCLGIEITKLCALLSLLILTGLKQAADFINTPSLCMYDA